MLGVRCGLIAELLFLQSFQQPSSRRAHADCVVFGQKDGDLGDEKAEAHASNARKQQQECFGVVIGGWQGILVQGE
jgi:hypothetical protein